MNICKLLFPLLWKLSFFNVTLLNIISTGEFKQSRSPFLLYLFLISVYTRDPHCYNFLAPFNVTFTSSCIDPFQFPSSSSTSAVSRCGGAWCVTAQPCLFPRLTHPSFQCINAVRQSQMVQSGLRLAIMVDTVPVFCNSWIFAFGACLWPYDDKHYRWLSPSAVEQLSKPVMAEIKPSKNETTNI